MNSTYVPIIPFLEEFYRPLGRGPITVHEPWRSVIEACFTPDPVTMKLPYTMVILSAPKKTGKSLYAGGIALWFATCMSEPGDEVLLVANKREQVKGRVYKHIMLAVEHHPSLRKSFKAQSNVIRTSNGTTIVPITTQAGGEAGANPGLIIHDELWDWGGPGDDRLWTELTPVPTRRNSLRLVVTYAGYSATSTILYREWQAGMKCPPHPDFAHLLDDEGKPVVRADKATKTFMYWEHVGRMPWQRGEEGEGYYADQERKLHPTEFLRVHKNQWSSGEEGIDMDLWDACVDPDYVVPDLMPGAYLAGGADASFKKDLTAVMTVYRKGGKFYLGPFDMWQPDPKKEDFDLEATAEAFIKGLKGRFRIRDIYYDSYQFHTIALHLKRAGLRMVEIKQTEDNSKKMGNIIDEVLRKRLIVLPPDPRLRRQAASVTMKLSPDGVQLKKERARSLKIDAITALALALLAGARLPDAEQSVASQIMVLG